MVELVDAMIASGATWADTRSGTRHLRAMSSGSASWTNSHPSSPASPTPSSSRSSAGVAAERGEPPGGRGDPGGARRRAAADQPARRVHDDVASVVAPALRHERPRLALATEAELLVRDQLGDREAVVELGDVDVARRDASHPVRRLPGALERRPVGIVLVQ